MTRAIESTLVPMTHGIAYETMLPLFPYYSFFGNLAFPKRKVEQASRFSSRKRSTMNQCLMFLYGLLNIYY